MRMLTPEAMTHHSNHARIARHYSLPTSPNASPARRLVLTVNCDNAGALTLYRRTHFVDSGELYHGGRSGPRHLLWHGLP
jgi:hypothetical protein